MKEVFPMIRVIHWRQNVPAPPDSSPQAVIKAFNEVASAAGKVPGAGEIRWGFGHGGIVTVAMPTSYASGDAILKDTATQVAVAKVLALGIGIAEDYWVNDPQQVMPFIPPQ